ncbi:hypothetical protein PHLCEN_2v1337 [Hermanssonia centrifuga]|uniref:SYO1-like TPR repeats domain-containing protein n=1 Tax=Hermanssonia centrifuga TaxID=98765 RepID=A0A2R6S3F7_9APHY|nr:hypothetical protein PHLCEN_2v1337 [Hermanssonia centrifuga]
MSFLGSRSKLPVSTVTSAAQCLYVLTDDNWPATNELRTNGAYTACLLSIVVPDEESLKANGKGKDVSDDRDITLRVLCAGIMRNIVPIPPPSIASTVDIDRDIVLPTLEPVLTSISTAEASQCAQELITQEDSIPEIQKLSLKNSLKTDHRSPSEIELDRLERKLKTVQLALEILTGVCATLPDPEPPVEEEVGEEDPERDNDDEDMDQDDPDMEDDENTPDHADKQATSAALPSLVAPLLSLIQPTPLSFPPISGGLSPHPPTTSVLSAIHIRALECLNNVFLSLASPARSQNQNVDRGLQKDSGVKIWEEVWKALGAVGTEVEGPGQESRRDMWQVAVGVLWGIAVVWKGLLIPQEEQVKILMQLCESAADVNMKVKCIGTLECLAQHPESIDANRVISNYFLTLIPSPTRPTAAPAEPLLQALSALIDVYSDESVPYDINFRQGDYLAALAASVEGVRKAVRGIDRKRERELRRRGEEVRDNLVAFIEYRRGLRL